MATPRAIDMALDLARMPTFAHSMSASPLPDDILEVICIAAEAPEACRAASLSTGVSEQALVEAARFYLQQVLFRPGADCYRILGIRPDDSRAAARAHMGWLLQWLHPDRNGDWDAVYTKQVVRAWREISSGAATAGDRVPARSASRRRSHRRPPVRFPLIELPREDMAARRRKSSSPRLQAGALKVAAGLFTILLLLGLSATASGGNPLCCAFSEATAGLLSTLYGAW